MPHHPCTTDKFLSVVLVVCMILEGGCLQSADGPLTVCHRPLTSTAPQHRGSHRAASLSDYFYESKSHAVAHCSTMLR